MLEIIDITVPIYEGMVAWPGSPQTVLEPSGRMDRGDSSNTTYCHLGAHAGTHKALLRDNTIALIEGVDLRRVHPGYYWFVCLPLKIVGCDGAPARALLIRDATGAFLEAWDNSAKSFR